MRVVVGDGQPLTAAAAKLLHDYGSPAHLILSHLR